MLLVTVSRLQAAGEMDQMAPFQHELLALYQASPDRMLKKVQGIEGGQK